MQSARAHILGGVHGSVRRLCFGPSSFVRLESQDVGHIGLPECALEARVLPIEALGYYRTENGMDASGARSTSSVAISGLVGKAGSPLPRSRGLAGV